jgi:hypothetical protein
MGKEVVTTEKTPVNQLVLLAENETRRIQVEFNPETCEMAWTSKNGVEKFEVYAGPGVTPIFRSNGISYGTGELAKKIIETLLGKSID